MNIGLVEPMQTISETVDDNRAHKSTSSTGALSSSLPRFTPGSLSNYSKSDLRRIHGSGLQKLASSRQAVAVHTDSPGEINAAGAAADGAAAFADAVAPAATAATEPVMAPADAMDMFAVAASMESPESPLGF